MTKAAAPHPLGFLSVVSGAVRSLLLHEAVALSLRWPMARALGRPALHPRTVAHLFCAHNAPHCLLIDICPYHSPQPQVLDRVDVLSCGWMGGGADWSAHASVFLVLASKTKQASSTIAGSSK